ncbi:MAG: hypothetical protein IPG34_10935 [Rhodocyclaceae bacterium]|nr:hypothetical protein [Rhodocyclaceae bacterium]
MGSTDPSKAMRGLGVLLEKDDSTWVSPDGKTTLRKEQGEDGDRWTLSLPEGGSVDLGAEFKEGDFGLRRLKLAEGNPDKLLEGDLLPKDFDTRTPDVLDVVHNPDGNVILADAKKAPNREDHLIGTLGVDSIQGKGGDDVLEGDRAAERDGGDDSTAQNDGGDDRLEGGVGSDIVAGQGGNDLLWGESAPADATTTNDSITAALESGDTAESKATRGDWIDGGKGDDILIGGAAKDLLTGGVGSDLLIGGAGDDLLHGDRTIKVGSSREWEVTVDPKVPFDPKSPDQVKTEYTWTIKNGDTVGNDTEGGDDSLYGGKGDDWLLGGAGNDLLEGGDDDDVLFGEAGHDTLLGGAGSDVLHGDSPDITEDKFGNWLDGGSEDDEIFGGKGADVLIGGTGDDFLRGGEGRDTYIYNKGDGKDRVYDKDADKDSSVFVFGEGISAKDIILRKGSLLLDFGDGDELHIEEFNADDPLTNPSVASFEFADGGSFTWEELLARGFDLDGIEGDDLLTGTALQDRVDGKAGNDALQSGAGNDRLTGGAGTDALDGGLGDDTYVFHAGDGASRSIQINGETALQVETVVDEGGVDTLAFDASVDTRTLQLIDNDEGNLLIRYGSQAQAEQGQEGSDLLLVGQGLAGNIEHVKLGAGRRRPTLSMTQFIGQYGEGVYRGTDATGHTHLTGGRSADFIVGSNGDVLSGGRGSDGDASASRRWRHGDLQCQANNDDYARSVA